MSSKLTPETANAVLARVISTTGHSGLVSNHANHYYEQMPPKEPHKVSILR